MITSFLPQHKYFDPTDKVINLFETITCEPLCSVYDRILILIGDAEVLETTSLGWERQVLGGLRRLVGTCKGRVRVLLVGGGGEMSEDLEGSMGGYKILNLDLDAQEGKEERRTVLEGLADSVSRTVWRGVLGAEVREEIVKELEGSSNMYVCHTIPHEAMSDYAYGY